MPLPIYWLRQLKEYSGLLAVLGFVLVAVGFRTSGPGERLAAVEKDVAALKTRQISDSMAARELMRTLIDSLTRTLAPTQKRTDALARYRCIHLDPETAYTLDLDCNTLIPGYPQFKGRVTPDDEDPPTPANVRPSFERLRQERRAGLPQRIAVVAPMGPALPPATIPAPAALFVAASRVRLPVFDEDAS